MEELDLAHGAHAHKGARDFSGNPARRSAVFPPVRFVDRQGSAAANPAQDAVVAALPQRADLAETGRAQRLDVG
jgi:hypothetical protein